MPTNKPYFIIEVANTHGGDFDYLLELIDAFKIYRKGFGMKFQVLHPDRIATEDFSYYNLYQKLRFDQDKWEFVISKAAKTKDVWLDIFDTYGVEVLIANIEKIHGIKFQSSVLYNYEVFNALADTNLNKHKVILNVAAQPIDSIREIIGRVNKLLKPQEILLEFGYQAYPTALEDSGYNKLNIINTYFDNKTVFADHVDGKSSDAIYLPIVVAMAGIDVIEKHVMLEDRKTEYDYFSSLTPSRFAEMINQVNRYTSLMEKPFINEKEKVYLKNSMMIPILKNDKPAGSLLNFNEDFIYRRSGKTGLNVKEIEDLQKEFHILDKDKKAGFPLHKKDFKKAIIATIIACRLKSTRLPKKALLPIGGIPSVERCIKSCLEFKNVNHTILATSDLPEDAELKNYTYSPEVIFYKGDPDDVIQRYLGACQAYGIDVIVRATADCPVLSPEIAKILLEHHFRTGADYTAARVVAVGTACEIYSTKALRKVIGYLGKAEYSEYMTWYMQNNQDIFKVEIIDLPSETVRDYRLILDYPEDLEMFNSLYAELEKRQSTHSLLNIFAILDENQSISNINSHLTLLYKTDIDLIDTLNRETKINIGT